MRRSGDLPRGRAGRSRAGCTGAGARARRAGVRPARAGLPGGAGRRARGGPCPGRLRARAARAACGTQRRPGRHPRIASGRCARARCSQRSSPAPSAARPGASQPPARIVSPRSERGAVAIAAVALLLLLALVAGAGLRAGRALLLDERVHGSADAVALAAASVLEARYGAAVDDGGSAAGARAIEAASRAAAERASAHLGLELESISFERSARDPAPIAVRVRVASGRDHAGARAGLGFAQPAPAQGFRLADVRGLGAGGAVVAAALAQLGWPYVWGGESRAEGGFDCSGLIDYAFAAAGVPVGRLTAAGLQQLAQPLSEAAAPQAGDLVFVGLPAHHVGLVVAPGLAVEAPHRGARVRIEPLGDGGWTGAGRILPAGAAGGGSGDGDL